MSNRAVRKKIRKRCEKKVLNRQKRCEIANIEEFPMENLYKPYIYSCRNLVGKLYTKKKIEKGVKKGAKSPKKV